MANASLLTSATLQLSTHATSTAVNHTFEFVTPTGVDASSDVIVLEYASGFSLGSVAFGDIDLAVDDDAACDGAWSDKTLAASAASGTWGAAVSGQRVTLTAPTDAASGEITSGRCVQVQIGTNASSGTNQITNPSSAASYEVNVFGTFGDIALYAVGITGTSGLPVTAIVSSGDSGDPPTLPPGDTAGPVISNVLVSSITATSATITWDTNEPASRTLSVGESVTYEVGDYINSGFRTSHTETVSGLLEAAEYHFQIVVADDSGNGTTSEDFTFTTLDATPPVLGLSIENITESTADVVWSTDEPTSSTFEVVSIGTFVDANLVTSSSQVLIDLDAETTYTVLFEVSDAVGNITEQTTTFTTLEDLPPSNVMNLMAAPGDTVITLSWNNPLDTDFDEVLLLFRTDTFPTDPGDGTNIYTGADEVFIHTGLVNGQEYFYTIFAADDARQVSSGATVSATPVAVIVAPDDMPIDPVIPPTDPDDPDPVPPGDDLVPDGSDDEPVDDDTTSDEPTEETDDVPAVDIEEPTPAEPAVLIPMSEVTFLVARDAITLTPDGEDVHVLAGRPLAVELDLVNAPSQVLSVELELANGTFLMNPETLLVSNNSSSLVEIENEALYAARVITPQQSGVMQINVNYLNGDVQVLTYNLYVNADGSVSSEQAEELLDDVAVSLYQLVGDWQLWNGASFAQSNPVRANGFYAWYVPDGTYRIEAIKEGYSTVSTVGLAIENNMVNVPIEMIALLPPIDEMIEGGVPPVSAAIQKVQQSIKILRQDTNIKVASSVATPIVAVSAASTAVIVVTALNGLRFLQYLFTAPFLLFKRRRRKRWGVVYGSLQKIPVDLAIVRLLDAQSGRVVKSQVTDRKGRYLFIAKPGKYVISVKKDGFTFPSDHLKSHKRDGDYLDLYHGEPIVVKESEAVIAANIPLDPAGEAVKTPAKIRFERWTRRVMYLLSAVGVVVAIVVAFLQPSTWTVAVAIVQVLVLLLFIRMAIPNRPKSWGIVYDNKTRRPVANAIVRIFEPKYNKLLETQITDGRGRYAFLVGPNEFYTTYEKGGYTKLEVRPIDRTDAKEVSYVSVDVGLKKN